MLAGEEAVPKGDKPRERNIRDYDAIVQTLRTVTSNFVSIKRPVTSAHATPADGCRQQHWLLRVTVQRYSRR